jgi:hypothetical protein
MDCAAEVWWSSKGLCESLYENRIRYNGGLWTGEMPEVGTRRQCVQYLKGGRRFLPHR